MTEAVIVAIITGSITLIGNIIALLTSARRSENNMNTKMAVMETQLNALTEEVRTHNSYGTRIVAIETKVAALEKKAS